MEYNIKKITANDKNAVKDMMRDFYATEAVFSNGSEEIFENNVRCCIDDNPYLEGYVFKNNNECLGYAMLAKSYSTEFGRRCIWIEDIYIKPQYRKMGIGNEFFKLLFEIHPDMLYRLEVESENSPAIGLYKKCGFDILPYKEMYKLG